MTQFEKFKELVQNEPSLAMLHVTNSLTQGDRDPKTLMLIEAGLPQIYHSRKMAREEWSLHNTLLRLQETKVENARPVLRAWLSQLNNQQKLSFFRSKRGNHYLTFGLEAAKEHFDGSAAGAMVIEEASAQGLSLKRFASSISEGLDLALGYFVPAVVEQMRRASPDYSRLAA